MDQSVEDLGLNPDLSRLHQDTRALIRHGSRDGHLGGGSEAAVAVCMEMFRAGYGVDQFWMVMTDPESSISKSFFEKDREQGEAWLEWIICEAYEAVAQGECDD